ncbi:MAG: hypothetical protein GF383_16495 [Candidatus Lokiarchaeota archaeon]|nr:hypothetical protein [Candidatus Lokiarchaeota archaeon]
MQNNRRTMAIIDEGIDVLEKLENQELVGKSFEVRYNPQDKYNKIKINS